VDYVKIEYIIKYFLLRLVPSMAAATDPLRSVATGPRSVAAAAVEVAGPPTCSPKGYPGRAVSPRVGTDHSTNRYWDHWAVVRCYILIDSHVLFKFKFDC
jgi:hypothetical protein